MLKRVLCVCLFFLSFVSRADEGMWLMYLLGDKVYQDMVSKGLKLSKDQLFSLNKSSLKDAIVIFGNGCTGELVSGQGLIFTNHHCGYGAIASASSEQNNYLRDGFWAKTKQEEISSPNLSVRFLVRIDDVTARLEESVKGLTGQQRSTKLEEVSSQLAREVTATGLEGTVVPFFKGNQFLLFVYERFTDIRLVGTPPESIGKFGGDTDNWEWPRHTGDFAVFRVYASKAGKPASYSTDNVPLKPKHFLPVSTKGVKENDFAMIIGYPGGTNRYETSYGVKLKTEIENPAIVELREERLAYMLEEMKKDPATKLKLASAYASIANYWKFYDGERKQLLKYDIYGRKLSDEKKFQEWAKGKPGYDGLFDQYERTYEAWRPYAKHRVYLNEGIYGSPLAAFAASLQALQRALSKNEVQEAEISKITQSLNRVRDNFIAAHNSTADRKILATTCRMFYENIDKSQHPKEFYAQLAKRYGDLGSNATYQLFADDVFERTMLLDDARWRTFIARPDSATLNSDPAFSYVSSFILNWNKYLPAYNEFTLNNADLSRLYMKGIMEMKQGKPLYPDANFTMRLSYGSVKPYRPQDAVSYDFVCTLSGAIEKYIPGDYEFDLPKKLIELYEKKDFGRYKDPRVNDIVVCYITTNDITGGNSGSPVINGNGELTGLAFDGNYEALSHKIAFDSNLNRTICVDVRYVLFIIEKLGGATNIIQELTLK